MYFALSNCKYLTVNKSEIYSIAVYDSAPYEKIEYDKDKNLYYIDKDYSNPISGNNYDLLDKIRSRIKDKNIADSIFISENIVYQGPRVVIYTYDESKIPTVVIYRNNLDAAIARYTILKERLSDDSEFIEII